MNCTWHNNRYITFDEYRNFCLVFLTISVVWPGYSEPAVTYSRVHRTEEVRGDCVE